MTVAALNTRYKRLFVTRSGYVPRDRAALDTWLKKFSKQLAKATITGPLQPTVAALAELIATDGIARMYVDEMIEQVPARNKTAHNTAELLQALDMIITTAPEFEKDPKKRNFFPMSSLFVYMMMTVAGEAAFRYPPLNDALRAILKAWCQHLDSPESLSVINRGPHGWLSKAAWKLNELDQFIIPDPDAPHGGFASFNAYFHREINLEYRPLAGPGDPKVITSANDGTVYAKRRDVKLSDRFWLKGQPYSLENMLAQSPFTERFVGGDVLQSFLSGADYHRWRSPIGGTVREARVVNGLMFSDAESAGEDTTAGTYSQGYEASVNTRGLVFIESPIKSIGMVCVIPIGITEISSVTINVKPGDEVEKGGELGWFSYGGSTLALVFQKDAIKRFTVPQNRKGPDDGPPIKVNQQVAEAN
jgi:phosphatidylserine decarboxylase